MRRVLAYCWGKDASTWAGKRVTLYYDPDVTFGKDKPGGTRISHLSHIDGPMSAPIMVSKGKSGKHRVEPLPDVSGLDEFAPETTHHVAPESKIDGHRQAMLFRDLKRHGLDQREAYIAWASEVLGKEVESTKELTHTEADVLLAQLRLMDGPVVAELPMEDVK